MTDVAGLLERLKKPVYSDDLMIRWDCWRKLHKEGFGGSATRDEFESIIDWIDEERAAAASALERLHALAQAQAAEIERLREERKNAQSTLSAWFDLSKKAEEAGASILEAALDTWLRRASSGGMPSEQADIVRNVVTDAARLYLWHALVPVLRTLDEEREARLAEAVEVIETARRRFELMAAAYDGMTNGVRPSVGAAELRAFLATMEKTDG